MAVVKAIRDFLLHDYGYDTDDFREFCIAGNHYVDLGVELYWNGRATLYVLAAISVKCIHSIFSSCPNHPPAWGKRRKVPVARGYQQVSQIHVRKTWGFR